MRARIFLCMAFLLCVAFTTVKAQQVKTCASDTPPTVTAIARPSGELQQAVTVLPENDHPYGGTFQFIIKKGQAQELFTTDVLLLIEEKREENREVMLTLSENTKVRILSKRDISSAGFEPIKNLYSFE